METLSTLSVNKNKFFWILLIFCILILSFPILYRFVATDGLLIGDGAYYDLRLSENTDYLRYDPFSFGGRFTLIETIWVGILTISPFLLSWLLPILLGISSFIIFYFIVKHLKKDLKNLASLFLVISPLFIYLFSTSSKYAAATCFALVAFLFFLKGKNVLSLLSLFLVSLFSSLFGIIAFLCLLFYYVYRKKAKFLFLGHTVLLFLTFLTYYWSLFDVGFGDFFLYGELSFDYFVSQIFVNFGASFGIGLFMFMLCLFGIYNNWAKNYKFVLIYLGFVFALVLSVYLRPLLFLLLFFVIFYAAQGARVIYLHRWKVPFAKTLVVLLLIAGLLFTFVSYNKVHVTSYPSEDYANAMDFLTNEGKGYVVLSNVYNGHFISYGGNRNLLDSNFLFAPNAKQKYEEIQKFYYLKDSDEIQRMVYRYDIHYILVDKVMKRNLWHDKDEGLLYFLNFGDRKFFKAYNSEDVEIWELINQDY